MYHTSGGCQPRRGPFGQGGYDQKAACSGTWNDSAYNKALLPIRRYQTCKRNFQIAILNGLLAY